MPFQADSTIFIPHLQKSRSRLEKDLGFFEKHDKTIRKELSNIYDERFSYISYEFRNGNLYTDNEIKGYFNKILKEIIAANPELQADEISLFVSRHTTPNAYCLGEGTLIINLSLIRWFQNESQLAYIICHELAHQHLNHLNNAIEKSVLTFYSKETQKELKTISKAEYNRNQKAFNLLKGVIFEGRKHSRLNEAEADSMALVFFKRTKYDITQAITALALLDSVDTEINKSHTHLKKHFNSPAYPFKDSWLEEEKLLSGFKKEELDRQLIDSLKTHPDCKKRVELITPYAVANHQQQTFIQSAELFLKIRSAADFEMVESEFFFKDYGRTLYHALKLLDKYPENVYLHGIIGMCFYHIYEAQKKHELGKFVSVTGPHFDQEYNELLTFIYALRLSEISNLGFHFLSRHYNPEKTNEDFLFTYWQFAKLIGNAEVAGEVKNTYTIKHSKGKYIHSFITH